MAEQERGRIKRIDGRLATLLAEAQKETNLTQKEISGILCDFAQRMRFKEKLKNRLEKFRSGILGSINDIPTMWTFMIGLAVAILVTFMILSEINDANVFDTGRLADTMLQQAVDDFDLVWDNVFFLFFTGLAMFVLITSFIFRVSSFWFWLSFLALGFYLIVIIAPLGFMYNELTDVAAIRTFADAFPKMTWIFDHSVLLATVFGGLVLMINHLSPAGEGNMGGSI